MTALGDDLLRIVNQLQDLVFNTIGTDSLDLPQIVSTFQPSQPHDSQKSLGPARHGPL